MDDAFALLRLQVEWGADEAIGLDPIDRLRPLETKPAPLTRPVAAAEPPIGTPGERALAAAARASTLEELRTLLAGFDG